MSIDAALASNVFLTYAAIVGGVLLLAGAVLYGVLRAGPKIDKIRTTYVGWLVMVPLVGGAVFLGREAFIIFVGVLSLAGFLEYTRAVGLHRDLAMSVLGCLGVAACTVTAFVDDPDGGRAGWYNLFIVLPVYMVVGTLAVPILRNRVEGQLQAMCLTLTGMLLIGWMLGHLALLANSPRAYGYLLYVLLATELNDVAAFTCGRLFGRTKLRDRISPNKTVEGSVGALVVSMALPWALWFGFPHFTPAELVLAGLIVGVGGQFGDLSISLIKREVGVKDTGSLIPGHGGILDRVDSLLWTAPLFFHMAKYHHGM